MVNNWDNIIVLKELEDQLVVCMRCGLCQSVCPLYAETGREADVARGKLALLDGLRQEMFQERTGITSFPENMHWLNTGNSAHLRLAESRIRLH